MPCLFRHLKGKHRMGVYKGWAFRRGDSVCFKQPVNWTSGYNDLYIPRLDLAHTGFWMVMNINLRFLLICLTSLFWNIYFINLKTNYYFMLTIMRYESVCLIISQHCIWNKCLDIQYAQDPGAVIYWVYRILTSPIPIPGSGLLNFRMNCILSLSHCSRSVFWGAPCPLFRFRTLL